MKQHQGIWLPDHERHMIEWMDRNGEIVDGRGTYQIKKLRKALEFVKEWRVAVDVGAHVGFWSMHLAAKFGALHAFEPVNDHRECFGRNVRGANLYSVALGAAPGRCAMSVPTGSSGGTHISGSGEIEIRTLDSYELHFVDFIKIDCEGYELAVVQGAAETLKRCRPAVIVEQKPHILAKNFGTKGAPAVEFLTELGAKVRAVLSGDYILTWD